MKRFTLLFGLMVAFAMVFSACAPAATPTGPSHRNAFDGNGHANRGTDSYYCAANIDRLCRRITNRRVW